MLYGVTQFVPYCEHFTGCTIHIIIISEVPLLGVAPQVVTGKIGCCGLRHKV